MKLRFLSLSLLACLLTACPQPQDTTPNPFVFLNANAEAPNQITTSETIVLDGYDTLSPISISNGEYNIGVGWTAQPGQISPTQKVQLRLESGDYGGSKTATLNVGGVFGTFTVVTAAKDTTPNPLVFASKTNWEPNTEASSEALMVSGINAPASIAVTGGQYRINAGAWQTTPSTVLAGQGVQVQLRTSNAFDSESKATLTIGGETADFVVRTRPADTIPNPIAFANINNAEPNTQNKSETITVAGLEPNYTVVASVVGGELSHNGAAFASEAKVKNGDTLQLRATSAALGLSKTTTLNLGSSTTTWAIQTRPQDTTPDDFAFAPKINLEPSTQTESESLQLKNFEGPLPLSVTNGEVATSSDNVTFSAFATSANVNPNQFIKVRATSSAAFNTNTKATLVAGTVTKDFVLTTRLQRTTPAPFSFPAKTEQDPNTDIESKPEQLKNFDGALPILVTGGQYALSSDNGATYTPFTDQAGTIAAGQFLKLRVRSASTDKTTSSVSVTVGDQPPVVFAVTTKDPTPDTTPDAFVFSNKTNLEPNTQTDSDALQITGTNLPTSITVSAGGAYSTNGGAFTSAAGTMPVNASVKLRATSAAFGQSKTITLTVGGVAGTFKLETRPQDTTPDAFAFAAKTNLKRATLVESASVQLKNFEGPVVASVTGGQMATSNDNVTFSAFAATTNVNPNQYIKVRLTSSASFDTTTKALVVVGAVSTEFVITTEIQDLRPDAFVLNALTDQNPSTALESNVVTVAGINDAAPIAIVGGEYAIKKAGAASFAAFSNALGSVVAGDSVKVRLTSSPSFASSSKATLSIGSSPDLESAEFVVTTRAQDTTPDTFTFAPKTSVKRSTPTESASVQLKNFDGPIALSVSDGEMATSSDNVTFSAFAATANVNPNQYIKVRLTSSASFDTSTKALLTAGTATVEFVVTTEAQDLKPDPFAFVAQTNQNPSAILESNTIVVAGINDAAPIAVVGGEYAIKKAAAATFDPFTTTAATVASGDTVKVRATASANFATTIKATLSIGGAAPNGVSADFAITTRAQDTVPDAFTFAPKTNQALNTVVESASVQLKNFDGPIVVSVAGTGISNQIAVSSDNVTFSAFATSVNVNPNQYIKVRQTSSGSYTTTTATTVTVAGLSPSPSFAVTTLAQPGPTTIKYVIPAKVGATASAVVLSDTVPVQGITGATDVSIVGGEYAINDFSSFTSATTSATADFNLQVRVTASPTAGGVTEATVTVGGEVRKFIVMTAGPDVTPNAIALSAWAYCPGLTTVTSNVLVTNQCGTQSSTSVNVAGLGAPTPITVQDAEFQINSGAWQKGAALVQNGDTVALRQSTKALADKYQYSFARLTLGTVSAVWEVRTRRASNGLGNYPTVTFLNFNNQDNAAPNQLVESNAVTVASLEESPAQGAVGESFIFVIGDGAGAAEYSIDRGAGFGPWTSSTQYTDGDTDQRWGIGGVQDTIKNGNKVKLRLTSSATPGGVRSASLYIGGKGWELTDRFVVTTRNTQTPNAFSFVTQTGLALGDTATSNSVVIAGLDAPVVTYATGGTLLLNGVAQTGNATVQNGDTVALQVSVDAPVVVAGLNTGEASASFVATTGTGTPDLTPNTITFAQALPAPLDSPAESTAITIAGLGGKAPLRVEGGEYALNGAAWTRAASSVQNGDTVKVRLLEGLVPGSSTAIVQLRVGDATSQFKPTAGSFRLKLAGAPIPMQDGITGSSVCVSDGTGPETALGFTVPSTTSKISSVRVRLKIQHAWRSDMRIHVRPPAAIPSVSSTTGQGSSSKMLALMDWIWGDLPNCSDYRGYNLNAIFDDTSSTTWQNSPLSGYDLGIAPDALKPKHPLSVYNNQNPTGKWKVIVGDTAKGDVGSIQDAEMIFMVQ